MKTYNNIASTTYFKLLHSEKKDRSLIVNRVRQIGVAFLRVINYFFGTHQWENNNALAKRLITHLNASHEDTDKEELKKIYLLLSSHHLDKDLSIELGHLLYSDYAPLLPNPILTETDLARIPDELMPSILKDIGLKILSYLDLLDHARCAQVSKIWQIYVNASLKCNLIYTPVPQTAYGKRIWEKYFGDVGVEPPLPKNIYKILKSPCPIWPGKKIKETHLLALIPEKINEMPLTLQSLKDLCTVHLDEGDLYLCPSQSLLLPSSKSRWILMTKSRLSENNQLASSKQDNLVDDLSQRTKIPYRVPNILDATASLFIIHLNAKKNQQPIDFFLRTRTQEKYNSHYHLEVSCWPGEVGVHVNPNIVSSKGTAALWELPSLEQI